MKGKAILAVPVPEPSGKRYEVIATEEDIKGEKHLIVDLFDGEVWLLRWAFVQNDFMRYEVENERWSRKNRRNAWVESYKVEDFRKEHIYAPKASEEIIRRWCNNYSEIIDCVFGIEDEINRKKEQKKRAAKENVQLQLFSEIPEIPEEFFETIKQTVQRGNLIYYKRHGQNAKYKCAQCGAWFEKRKVAPVQNETEQCPICKESGKLKWLGRSRTECEWEKHVLYQATASGKLLIRGFETRTHRSPWGAVGTETVEKYRGFFSRGISKEYQHYIWKEDKPWSEGGEYDRGFDCADIYPGYLQTIRQTDLKYCPLEELAHMVREDFYVRNDREGIIKEVLKAYAKCQQLEILYKMDLEKTCRKIIENKGAAAFLDKKQNKLEKILKIEKRDLQWIREEQGEDFTRLRVCQYIKKKGWKNNQRTKKMTLELLFAGGTYYLKEHEKRMKEITKYMSMEQAYNRIREYANKEFSDRMSEAQREYYDYLKMRAHLGYDMTNSVYLHPKHLHDTYDELRKEDERRKAADYIEKKRKQFPKIAGQYKKLYARYFYEKDEFIVRPARNVEEIILEGRTLHHCVGSESQSYMKNHNDGKAFILMLRKKEAPETPYATIEIRNTDIRQWYQANDKKPDREIIDPWLEEYVKQLRGGKKKTTEQMRAAV